MVLSKYGKSRYRILTLFLAISGAFHIRPILCHVYFNGRGRDYLAKFSICYWAVSTFSYSYFKAVNIMFRKYQVSNRSSWYISQSPESVVCCLWSAHSDPGKCTQRVAVDSITVRFKGCSLTFAVQDCTAKGRYVLMKGRYILMKEITFFRPIEIPFMYSLRLYNMKKNNWNCLPPRLAFCPCP